MSDDSTPDNAPDAQDGPYSAPATESLPGEVTKRSSKRQFILVGLLGLMLFALAYDRLVARPSVNKAYDQIAELNYKMNSSASSKPTLNTDIHQELKRKPSQSYIEGQYRIEVFSWTAGLPFRTHDLFAVYIPNGNDLVFMRHYKFAMPEDEELDPAKAAPSVDGGEDPEDPPEDLMDMERPNDGGRGGPGRGGEGGGGRGGEGGGKGRPKRPSIDGEDENPGAEDDSPIPPDSEGDATPASAPLDDPTPDASEPDASEPDTSDVPAGKPAATQPPAEPEATPAEGETKKKDA